MKLARCAQYDVDDGSDLKEDQSLGATNIASPPKFLKTQPDGGCCCCCCCLLSSLLLLILLLHEDGDKYSAKAFGSCIEAKFAKYVSSTNTNSNGVSETFSDDKGPVSNLYALNSELYMQPSIQSTCNPISIVVKVCTRLRRQISSEREI